MTKDEALNMCFEYIETNAHGSKFIRFIKEALAQTEPKPVELESVYETIIQWDEGGGKRSRRELARRIVSLYHTSPHCKPLTDEAIATVYWGATGQSLRPQDNVLAHNFARAIEATHGIKV